MSEPQRNRLEWLGWGAVAVAAVLAVVFGTRLGEPDPVLVPSPLIGEPVADLVLPDLESGASVAFAEQRGEIMVITFFASWCAPCQDEQPALVAAANQFADDDVQFIGVLYQDQLDDANRFLDEYGRSAAAVYLADPQSRAAIEFGLFGIPETFFVDRDGIIVGKVSGGVDLPILLATIEAIDEGRVPGAASTGETFQSPEC